MTKPKKSTQIKSLLVGFSIIDVLAKHPKPLKFNDIQHKTKITKSNLYKYLNTLTSLGVLYRDREDGTFSLGTTLIKYGMSVVNREDIVNKIKPFLEEINLKLKETTLFTVWTNEGPMIVKMIHSSSGLNLGGQVGTILPIHSAAGKLFAAFKNNPLSDQWKKNQYKMLDKKQIKELESDFEDIRN